MKRYRQFHPVLIEDFETAVWQHPVHKHNHYELIYIKKGAGRHYINKEVVNYETGNVFLLGPEEEHYFEIDGPTRFIYLKFTDRYLHLGHEEEIHWIQQLEYLIKSREARLSRFMLNAADQETVSQLFHVIISLKAASDHDGQLIWLLIMSLAVLLKRNLPEIVSHANRGKDMQVVFCYIHAHIYTPHQLKAAVMAAHFNTTPDYIGPYFKRNTGITLRTYIQHYRKALIRKRLENGHYSLKQIAAEFGLTDESHVSKLLK